MNRYEEDQDRRDLSVKNVINGSRLRVHVDEQYYEGWGETRTDKSILLYDARRDDGEQFDTVVISEPDIVEQLVNTFSIELVPPEKLHPSPYDVRETDLRDVAPSKVPPRQHKRIYEHQKLFSYPVANSTSNERYVLIAGHRRVAAAKHAGLERIPVKVIDVTEWTAAQMFVHEHFSYPTESAKETPELYTSKEANQSLRLLREQWSDKRLKSLLPVRELIEDVRDEAHQNS